MSGEFSGRGDVGFATFVGDVWRKRPGEICGSMQDYKSPRVAVR